VAFFYLLPVLGSDEGRAEPFFAPSKGRRRLKSLHACRQLNLLLACGLPRPLSKFSGSGFSEVTMALAELRGRQMVFIGDIGWPFRAAGLDMALATGGRWRVLPGCAPTLLFDGLSLFLPTSALQTPSTTKKIKCNF
jgi:hypothetical protein